MNGDKTHCEYIIPRERQFESFTTEKVPSTHGLRDSTKARKLDEVANG
jgi:hypothetical protein